MQLLTQIPLLKALGWALFNSLWQMAFLWVLYSLLILIFHTTAARIRHGLAFLLLTIGTVWSAISFLAAWLFPDNGMNFSGILSPAQSAPGWFWQTTRSFMDLALPYVSTVYLLVLFGLVVRCVSHYRHSRKLTRQGLSAMPPEFRTFVTATSLRMSIQPVRAWLSSLVDVPLTLGFLKPVILLPAAMVTRLTPQQVESILVHELAHIRRKDYLLHLIVTLLQGLFFFNPFSRLLIAQLKKERENCCDDFVLQFKYDPHSYVSALLSLATQRQLTPQMAVAATGGGDRLLLQRAKRILLQKQPPQQPGTRSLMMLVFTLLATLITFYPARHRGSTSRPGSPLPLSPKAPALSAAGLNRSISLRTDAEVPFRLLSTTSAGRRQIVSIRSAPAAHPHRPVARLSKPAGDDNNFSQSDDDNNVFVNTALDDATIATEAMPTGEGSSSSPGVSSGDGAPGSGRDYSLNEPATVTGPTGDIGQQDGAPFVPNSSFSFQYTTEDSTKSLEKLLYIQQSGTREVLAALTTLQQHYAHEVKALNALLARPEESARLRQQIRAQQQHLLQEYLRKISSWQKKLEKATHFKMIVYI